MKISTKGRYALRVMVDLAQQKRDEYISLKAISERQEISMKYLETIAAGLHTAGFIMSLRGKCGGYRLARNAGEYTVGSVLKLTEGSLAPVTCLENNENTCGRARHCITLPMWQKLDKMIDDYFESITIEDLITQQNKLAGNDYVI
jgi:Rrf2 family iron-sulfur cluster assembly transcriptional regulator